MKTLIYELFSGVGFCNQLFSLETAIYLSNVMNRKLILLIKSPLSHCGKTAWDNGKIMDFFNDSYKKYLPCGIEIMYTHNTCNNYLDTIENKYIFPNNNKHNFSNIVFVDNDLYIPENTESITKFINGKHKTIINYKELLTYEYLYVKKSNASRVFTNFYTNKQNYILMSKIALSLTKFRNTYISDELKDITELLNKDKYDIGIHFRFGDIHRGTNFINQNNNTIKNNLIDRIKNKNILIMTDNYKNTLLNQLIPIANKVIFLDKFVKETLGLDDSNNNRLKIYHICQQLLLYCPIFIGTVGSTVSVYLQYLRYINNLSYNHYINRSLLVNDKKDEFTWSMNKLHGHLCSWSYFVPDNIYICNDSFYFYQKDALNIKNNKNKKVISFCLYGLNDGRNQARKFDKGVYVNYEYMKKLNYKDWIMRVYIPYNEPKNVIDNLIKFKNIEIILVDTNICLRSLRFLPYNDRDVSHWVSRDLDSILNEREDIAVNDWLTNYKDKNLMMMCDNYQHVWTIAGGMFGFKNDFKKNIISFILDYSVKTKNNINKFANDCEIAELFFYEENNYIQYRRAGKKLKNSKTFPDLKQIHCGFVGNICNIDRYYTNLKCEEKYPFLKQNKTINLFNLDLHASVIEDVIYNFKKINKNIHITQWSMSGHTWVFNKPKHNPKHVNQQTWTNFNLKTVDDFCNEYNNELKKYDGFIVTHSPVFCLLYERYDKPIFLVNSCRYLIPYCWHRNDNMLGILNKKLKQMFDKKQLFIISNNLGDAEFLKLGTGIDSVYNPSLCLYTNIKYKPTTPKFLLLGNNNLITQNNNIVYKKDELKPRYKWDDLYKYKGLIIMPYEISTMSIFEYYSADIPLIFPSKKFIRQLYKNHNLHLSSRYFKYRDFPKSLENPLGINYIDWWTERADFYNDMKYITYYDSIDQLYKLINTINTSNISFQMMLWNFNRQNRTNNVFTSFVNNYLKMESNYSSLECKTLTNIPISIIIPTYPPHFNKLDNLICNIVCQTVQPEEVIICASECSIDMAEKLTKQLISKHNPIFDLRFSITVNKNNAAENRNRGIKCAKSKYIMNLDCDDYSHCRKIEIMKYLLYKYPNVNLICHSYSIHQEPSCDNLNFYIDVENLKIFNDSEKYKKTTMGCLKVNPKTTNLGIEGKHIHHAHIIFNKDLEITFNETVEYTRREDGKLCQDILFNHGNVIYLDEKLTLYNPKHFNSSNRLENREKLLYNNIPINNNMSFCEDLNKLTPLQKGYVKHLNTCYLNADNEKGTINPEIFKINGMSGRKTRFFLNSLGNFDDMRYLEVGSWKGSTSCSVLSNNVLKQCTLIDNWSQFGGPKEECIQNIIKHKNTTPIKVYEMHCFHNTRFGPKTTGQPKPKDLDKFNFYFYDGHHTEDAQYMGLYHYLPCLDDTFIYMCDDWNWEKVRNGTCRAISDAKLKILWKKEIRLTMDETHTPAPERDNTWWNGFAIFLLQKTKKQPVQPKSTEIFNCQVPLNALNTLKSAPYKFSGIGQINMNIPFGQKIYEICKNNNVKNIVEVGTWNGQGTTVCLMNGIVGKNNSHVYSIEANKGQHNRANIFWKDKDTDKQLSLLFGKLHQKKLPDLEYLYKNNFIKKSLEECHYKPEAKLLEDPNVPLLDLSKLINNIDMIIIDGGEYTSEGDFEVLMKFDPTYVVLDDTRVYKCHHIRKKLLNDKSWKNIYDLQHSRHGESIFMKV
jgi:hypothetical protein